MSYENCSLMNARFLFLPRLIFPFMLDLVIVGAGVAGLNAALRMEKNWITLGYSLR